MTKQELLEKADYYKNLIDNNKSTNFKQSVEVDRYFRIELTYSSNSIGGNSISKNEIKRYLEDGKTEGEKPRKDYLEAAGHAEAYDYMLLEARAGKLEITEAVIKKLHELFYHKINEEEAGMYRTTQDENHSDQGQVIPLPEDVPHLMEHFINQMESSKRFMHPVEFAALCHKRLLDIHPFRDGNGRIARLFMNLILVNAGYGVTCITPELSNEYWNAYVSTRKKNNLDIDTFLNFIAGCVIESEKVYCNLLKIN